jgi:hypothetical protein
MGNACRNEAHRPHWRVTIREANYSAFNGYHYTPSEWSEVQCGECRKRWRTRAAYVCTLPDWDAS